MDKISVNGKICTTDDPVLPASNRGYRYGDAVFETIRVSNGRILLENLHFERLFESLRLLNYNIPAFFTADKLRQEILQLCKINNCSAAARVRLSISRGSGGLYDNETDLLYIIESWQLKGTLNELNENGLIIDVCPGIVKHYDRFSHIKSSNFLPYVMAASWAREQKLNDCLLLNAYGRVADATIANIFIVFDGKYITPPVEEGCIAGVMRRHLLEEMKKFNLPVTEQPITMDDVEGSTAVFLTNAIHGIRWVKGFRHATFTKQAADEIYDRFVRTIQ